jgi:hypothetical protein
MEYQSQDTREEIKCSSSFWRGIYTGIIAGALGFAYLLGPNSVEMKDLNGDGYKDMVVKQRIGDYYAFNNGDDTFVSLEDIAKNKHLQLKFKPR